MFLEKLFELIMAGWQQIAPFVVLEPYEGGGIIRLGIYHRTIGPGFSWKIPLIETCHNLNTCITTMRLPAQTLTTKDDKGVVATCVVRYSITKPEPYITGILDQKDVLADVTMGAVLAAVKDSDYETLRATMPERRVLETVRKQVNKYGFSIEAVTFTDFGRVRSIRLIAEHAANLDN